MLYYLGYSSDHGSMLIAIDRINKQLPHALRYRNVQSRVNDWVSRHEYIFLPRATMG